MDSFEERIAQEVAKTRSFLVQGLYDKALASALNAVAIQGEVIEATELAVQLTTKLLLAHEQKRDMLKDSVADVKRCIASLKPTA